MRKSGLEFFVLVSLLVGLVAGVLLIYTMYAMIAPLQGASDIEACRLSVLANARLKEKTTGFLETPISCPADTTVFSAKDKQRIPSVIAKQMKDCWYKMGEGKLEVFGRPWTETASSCLVCSEFRVEESLEVSAVKDHLSSKIPLEKRTYLEYLTVLNQHGPVSPDLFFIDFDGENPIPLATFAKETSYFILFIRQSKSTIQSFFLPLSDYVSSLIGKVTEEDVVQDTQTLFGIPREKVSLLGKHGLCKDLYWEKGHGDEWT